MLSTSLIIILFVFIITITYVIARLYYQRLKDSPKAKNKDLSQLKREVQLFLILENHAQSSNEKLKRLNLPMLPSNPQYSNPEYLISKMNDTFNEIQFKSNLELIQHGNLITRLNTNDIELLYLIKDSFKTLLGEHNIHFEKLWGNITLSNPVNNNRNISTFWRLLLSKSNEEKQIGDRIRRIIANSYAFVLKMKNDGLDVQNRTQLKNKLFSDIETFKEKSLATSNSRDLTEIGLYSSAAFFMNDLDEDFNDVLSDFGFGFLDTPVETSVDTIESINGLEVGISSSIEMGVDEALTGGIPIFTIFMEGQKQVILANEGMTNFETSAKNFAVSVGSKFTGAFLGGKVGATVGTLILPGIGTLIGGAVGSLGGVIGGGKVAKTWKLKNFEKARKKFEKALNEMKLNFATSAKTFYTNVESFTLKANDRFSKEKESLELKLDKKIIESDILRMMAEALESDLLYLSSFEPRKVSIFTRKETKSNHQRIRDLKLDYENLLSLFDQNSGNSLKNISEISEQKNVLHNGNLDKLIDVLVNRLKKRNRIAVLGYTHWSTFMELEYCGRFKQVFKFIEPERNKFIKGHKKYQNQTQEAKREAEIAAAQV